MPDSNSTRRFSESDNLSGMPFGKWTVLEGREPILKGKGRYPRPHWECRCECGAVAWVSAHNLVQGQSLSCVRCRRQNREMLDALIGTTVEHWRVIGRAPNRGREIIMVCRCVRCEKTRNMPARKLRKGIAYVCLGCERSTGMTAVERSVWARLLWAASSRGLEVTVDWPHLKELLRSRDYRCALSGEPIQIADRTCHHHRGATTASVDRIDSTKGYIPGNVQWVHKDVNLMKGRLDNQRFIDLCKAITRNEVK